MLWECQIKLLALVSAPRIYSGLIEYNIYLRHADSAARIYLVGVFIWLFSSSYSSRLTI